MTPPPAVPGPHGPSAGATPPPPAIATAPAAAVDPAADDARVDAIAARGPTGAFVLAGIATALVVLLYLAFYALAYLPRGAVQ